MDKRKYIVYIGSKKYYYDKVADLCDIDLTPTFLELVKESDECRQRKESFEDYADILLIPNDNYNGITEQAHDRIGAIIKELTTNDAVIYIHNPPIVLKEYLKSISLENVRYYNEEYRMNKNERDFVENMSSISKQIIGQNPAIVNIGQSMWYLTKTNRQKPYVIMLYGNSSLGKTELVRKVAEKFYNNDYYEKHLSMFKNDTYSDYFFGERPNRKTLGYDLLERKSNLIFLDEIDKCPEHFYSAFYTLFDNTLFKDASYEADISGLLIILTSNYMNHDEMKKKLGIPIYYRIDKFIYFSDFTPKTIYEITIKEIQEKYPDFEKWYTSEQIYSVVSSKINTKNENARTIKNKIQEVIEELLFEQIKSDFEKNKYI
ncbi:MAG: AAA family ATPase [Anaerococcus hydrogenalis]|uniref:AAA family ATPase n=1 Tax=Anaerococcus TaxID=165779 RepID=UPI0029026EB8|nr:MULTISPECIES: AAA family ATPase [Anaerococcus]MDU2582651.1 AAA family ATPase [Anaerococcus hydrogenalis]MDU3152681.1 AAA family ATPase [Anaerococcus hydrogenalis]MDU3212390.1 AAA family ATPase [Anaerococcus sp.]MDU3688534.1 AAA family ATPase [Anaerococcus hydrogenalis]